MSTWGVSSEGFYKPGYDEIRENLEARWKARFGSNRNTKAASGTLDAKFVSFMTEIYSLLMESAEGAYQAKFVSTAVGAALHETGVDIIGPPKSALASTVEWVLIGDDTTAVDAFNQATLDDSNVAFQSDAAATIGSGAVTFAALVSALPASGTTVTITINATDFDYLTQPTDDEEEIATQLAAVINAGAEPVTAIAIGAYVVVDEDTLSSMTFAVSDDDTGDRLISYFAVRVAATATATGPTTSVAGSAWSIDTAVTGWDGVLNTADGTVGQDDESDADYRQRIRTSTRYGGITAKLLAVDGVTFARVYENVGESTDAEGRPPHSVECVVQGGVDDDIAQAIWDARRQGADTFSATADSGTAVDAAGTDRTVNFSRTTPITVYIDLVITQGEDWPATGSPLTEIRDAVVDYVTALRVGDDVTPGGVLAAAVGAVPQVADAVIKIDTVEPPVATGVLAISLRQNATTDSAKVTVA